MQAGNKNLLTTERQRIVSIQAKVLYDSFAKIGLVALIDEATGYQKIRDPSRGANRLTLGKDRDLNYKRALICSAVSR